MTITAISNAYTFLIEMNLIRKRKQTSSNILVIGYLMRIRNGRYCCISYAFIESLIIRTAVSPVINWAMYGGLLNKLVIQMSNCWSPWFVREFDILKETWKKAYGWVLREYLLWNDTGSKKRSLYVFVDIDRENNCSRVKILCLVKYCAMRAFRERFYIALTTLFCKRCNFSYLCKW